MSITFDLVELLLLEYNIVELLLQEILSDLLMLVTTGKPMTKFNNHIFWLDTL